MPDTQDQARKSEFDLHVAHVTEIHKAFIENTGKITGFLLLSVGWFATSRDARAFLASNSDLTFVAILAVVAAYGLSLAASWVGLHTSRKALLRLKALDYLPPVAYEARALGPVTFAVCAIGNGVLAGLVSAALWSNLPT